MMNGNSIGVVTIEKNCAGNKTELSLESKTKKRFIVSIEMYELHKEIFRNNTMTAASVLRQVNGKTKIAMQMNFNGENCIILSEGKTRLLCLKPVVWSVLNLYFTEPVNITEVFSDSYRQMLRIVRTGDHIYKIIQPDGNSNYFYYSNGICQKEIVHHDFYTVEFVLKEN